MCAKGLVMRKEKRPPPSFGGGRLVGQEARTQIVTKDAGAQANTKKVGNAAGPPPIVLVELLRCLSVVWKLDA